MIERFQVPGRKPSRLYSAVVRSGDLLFVAGQVSRDAEGGIVGAGDFRAQAEQTVANLKSALGAAGAPLSNVLRMTVYITDPRYRNDWRDITIRHFGDHLPASALITVSGLSEPEFLIEIDAIAAATPAGA